MKYTGKKMSLDTSLPSSVQSWLGHELEVRGIDAVIYTRYILSILQQDTFEAEGGDQLYFSPYSKKEMAKLEQLQLEHRHQQPGKVKKVDKHQSGDGDSDEMKKSAAVECLLSVSDEDSGIESLVDELYLKLKEQQEIQKDSQCGSWQDQSDSGTDSSSDDPAERYYAAFPALSKETEAMVTTQTRPPEGTPWAKVAQKAASDKSGEETEKTVKDDEGKAMKDDGYEGEGDDGEDRKKSREKGAEGQRKKEGRVTGRKKKDATKSRKDTPTKTRGHGQLKHSQNEEGFWNSPSFKNWEFENHNPKFVVPKVRPRGRYGYKMKSPGNQDIGLMPIGMDLLEGDTLDGLGSGKQWLEKLMEMMRQQEPIENQDWYTQPLEKLVPQSPIPSKRLYRRQPTLLEFGLTLSSIFEDGPDFTGVSLQDSADDTTIVKYLSQIKDILDRELGTTEEAHDDQENHEIITNLDKIEDKFKNSDTDCKCGAIDEDDNDIDLNIGDLWNLSSPGSREPTPVSKENDVLDDRPLFYLTKDLCEECQSQSNSEITPATSAGGSSVCSPTSQIELANWESKLKQAHSSWLSNLQEESAQDTAFSSCTALNCDSQWGSKWLPLFICDNCKSNKQGMFGDLAPASSPTAPLSYSGKPGLWASYLDIIVPALGEKHSYSTWQDLHASECTYDDDRPFDMSKSLSMLLSPKQEGTHTSQLWDVNVQRKFVDFEPIREQSSTLDTIQKYLLNIRFEKPDHPESHGTGFIKGGLYGNSLNTQGNIWERTTGLQDDVFTEEDGDAGLWHNFSSVPLFGRYKCTSLNNMGDLVEPFEGQSRCATEFLPSENTAFRYSIPSRLPFLPHVQSEPILSLDKFTRVPETGARLVQVKSLYKSDSSILTQLGLATQSEDSYREEIQVSADTHFRPIQMTPPKLAAQEAEQVYISPDPTPTAEEDEDSMFYLMGLSSSYQMYNGEEAVGHPDFIPRFKVEKEREKSAQTGEKGSSFKAQTESVVTDTVTTSMVGPVDSLQVELIFTSDMKDELEINVEDAERLTLENLESYELLSHSPQCGQDNSSDYESAPDMSLEDLHGMHLADLWDTDDQDNHDEEQVTPGLPPPYKSIWSFGTDSDIPSMPSSFTGANPVPFPYDIPEQDFVAWSTGEKEAGNVSEEEGVLEDWQPRLSDSTPTNTQVDSDDLDLTPGSKKMPFSSDLEEKWLSADSTFEVQKPRKKQRIKSAGQKKPCSFFMEGNCRRTDCKFAHDMSNITCRFWEEGDCFKGVTCPFLHGYFGSSGVSDADENANKTPQFSDIDMILDDANEFPELSKSKEEEENAFLMKAGLRKSVKISNEESSPKMVFISFRRKSERSRSRHSSFSSTNNKA